MAPAAALRGLAKGGFPSSSCLRLRRSKSSSVMYTSPRGSSTGGGPSSRPPGGGVPRGGKGRLPLLFLPPVETLEIFERHVHLASWFEHRWRAVVETLRDGADGGEVGRHFLADGAVAARRAANETPTFVAQRDGEAVYL